MADAEKPGGKITAPFLFAVFVAAFGSGFQYGYNAAVINAPQKQISWWIGNSSFNSSEPKEAERKVTLVYSAVVAIFCIGGLIGALLVQAFLSFIGLKWGIIANNIFVFIAAGLMGCTRMANSYYLLLAGRVFIGINAGLGAGLVPMYLTEIAPVSARGAVGSAYQLFITISILLAQIIGLHSILGNEKWPILFFIPAGVAVFQLICFPLCADSPQYLYSKGKVDDTRKSLVWLRGTNDVDDELDEIAETKATSDAGGSVGMTDMFTKGQLRKPLIISVMIMLAQQFSGINAVIYYSTSTFEAAKLSDLAEYGTLTIGVVNVTMTVISVFLVDKLGRKVLMVFSFAAMAVDTLLFFGTFLLAVKAEVQAASYACILFLILFIVFFAAGAGSIPWFIISELFAQNARAKAVTVVITVHWISNFTVGLTFPLIQDLIGPFVFLIFFVLQVLFLIYIIVVVPETKGKSVEEITEQFK